jgi:hypothetical protein
MGLKKVDYITKLRIALVAMFLLGAIAGYTAAIAFN